MTPKRFLIMAQAMQTKLQKGHETILSSMTEKEKLTYQIRRAVAIEDYDTASVLREKLETLE